RLPADGQALDRGGGVGGVDRDAVGAGQGGGRKGGDAHHAAEQGDVVEGRGGRHCQHPSVEALRRGGLAPADGDSVAEGREQRLGGRRTRCRRLHAVLGGVGVGQPVRRRPVRCGGVLGGGRQGVGGWEAAGAGRTERAQEARAA